MNNETFISKYKPYYLKDFCMNPKTMNIIRTLLEIDDLNILFIGQQGSGKTTLLYSLIREYYGLSPTANIPEINVLFINNLKEQGINYYRNEMKIFCQSHCSIYGKKKMIIIDDIDTINEQSQQVFRNYIDKYKHNIHFISVCSNIQKVIESIQSRVHTIRMYPPNTEEIKQIMNHIIQQESIVIDEDSKKYLLLISNESLRILINYLEKIYIYGEPVTETVCKKICSYISTQKFEEYIEQIRTGNLHSAISVLYEIYDQGYSVIDILDYLYNFVKVTSMLEEETKYKVIPLLCKYITVFNKIHEDVIELAFFSNHLHAILVGGPTIPHNIPSFHSEMLENIL
jgi:DNA polymerase III delta prime subunit